MRKLTSPLSVLTVLAFALVACSRSDSPTSPDTPEDVTVTVNVETHGFGTVAATAPNTIRVTVRDEGGAELDSRTESFSGEVSGDFGPFDISVPSNPVETVSVEAEVFHDDDSDAVLWSGTAGDMDLPSDGEIATDMDLYRGPLENLELTDISAIGLPAEMQVGSTTTLSATGDPSEIDLQPFWGALTPAVAEVDSSGGITAVSPGEAEIVVAAGTRSDTVAVTVTEGEPAPGEHGSSRRFERAEEQWVEVEEAGALSFPDEAWTFSVWVRPGDVEGEWFQYAVSSGDVFEGGGAGFQVYYGETNDVHHWHLAVNNDDGEGGHHVIPTPPRPTEDAWTHVALRYDGEGEIEGFINGSPRTRFDFSGAVNLPEPVNIGRRADADEVRYMDGEVAHLARWDGGLSDAQISLLARGMHPMSAEGETLEWFIPLGMDPEEAFGPVGENLSIELMNDPEVGSPAPVSEPEGG